MPIEQRQQSSEDYDGLSIVAAIRLDQARRGLRVVSQKAVRQLEQQAEALYRETPFTALAGISR